MRTMTQFCCNLLNKSWWLKMYGAPMLTKFAYWIIIRKWKNLQFSFAEMSNSHSQILKISNSHLQKNFKFAWTAAEKIVYKDFVLLSSNATTTPRGKERSKLEKEGFVVHAVPLKQNQTEEEIEGVVTEIFTHKLSQTSVGPKKYSSRLSMFFILFLSCH